MSASERLRAAEIAVSGLLAAAAQFFRQSQPDAAAADADFLVRSGESEDAPGRPLADPDLLGVICVQALIAGAIFYGTGSIWNYPLLWLLPLATVAKSLAHFRSVVEHTRTQDVGDAALSRLRTIESSRLEAFFFAPLHFNFHAEHPLYPGISFDKLPRHTGCWQGSRATARLSALLAPTRNPARAGCGDRVLRLFLTAPS